MSGHHAVTACTWQDCKVWGIFGECHWLTTNLNFGWVMFLPRGGACTSWGQNPPNLPPYTPVVGKYWFLRISLIPLWPMIAFLQPHYITTTWMVSTPKGVGVGGGGALELSVVLASLYPTISGTAACVRVRSTYTRIVSTSMQFWRVSRNGSWEGTVW